MDFLLILLKGIALVVFCFFFGYGLASFCFDMKRSAQRRGEQ